MPIYNTGGGGITGSALAWENYSDNFMTEAAPLVLVSNVPTLLPNNGDRKSVV